MSEAEGGAQQSDAAGAIHETDLAGIRSAVQWLLGAFGGVAFVVLAGTQLGGALNVVAHGGWVGAAFLVGLITVFTSLFLLARAAALVLVPDRTNLTDLLEYQAHEEARQSGIVLASGAKQGSPQIYGYVLGEISRARVWLLPPGCNDLDDAYQAYRNRSIGDQVELRRTLREIMAFARTEAALYRYRQLIKLLIGKGGLAFIVGLIVIVLALSPIAQKESSPPVTAPFEVEVYFLTPPDVHTDRDAGSTCRLPTGKGVAVGGTIAEPEVVIAGTQSCPPVKIRITADIGYAVPLFR